MKIFIGHTAFMLTYGIILLEVGENNLRIKVYKAWNERTQTEALDL